jgi:hypothetical protein
VIVNELSNTIDLESTLVRAEALYRRFQRTVEAINKKSNFPLPKLRQRPVQNAAIGATQALPHPASAGTSSATNATVGSSSATDARTTPQRAAALPSPMSKGKGRGSVDEEIVLPQTKVISPELRALMSRKVEILPRKLVRKEGDGLGKLGKK